MKKLPDKTTVEIRFISAGELARRWGFSISAVYMHRGGTERLTRYRFGRSVRFELADVEKHEEEILKTKNKGEKNNER